MLFHPEVYWPEWVTVPTHRVFLNWSRHADSARKNDRFGQIPAIQSVTLGRFKVVEIEVQNRRVIKWVFRGQLSGELDIVLVLIPQPGRWLVKTVWLNEKTDTHRTLDKKRYATIG